MEKEGFLEKLWRREDFKIIGRKRKGFKRRGWKREGF